MSQVIPYDGECSRFSILVRRSTCVPESARLLSGDSSCRGWPHLWQGLPSVPVFCPLLGCSGHSFCRVCFQIVLATGSVFRALLFSRAGLASFSLLHKVSRFPSFGSCAFPSRLRNRYFFPVLNAVDFPFPEAHYWNRKNDWSFHLRLLLLFMLFLP